MSNNNNCNVGSPVSESPSDEELHALSARWRSSRSDEEEEEEEEEEGDDDSHISGHYNSSTIGSGTCSGSDDDDDDDDSSVDGSDDDDDSDDDSDSSSHSSSSIDAFLDRVRTVRKTTRGSAIARCSASVSDNSGSNNRDRNNGPSIRIPPAPENVPATKTHAAAAGSATNMMISVGGGGGNGHQQQPQPERYNFAPRGDPPETSSPALVGLAPSLNNNEFEDDGGGIGEHTTISVHSPRSDAQETFLTEESSPRPHVRVTVTDTRVVPVVHSFSSLEYHTFEEGDDTSDDDDTFGSDDSEDEDDTFVTYDDDDHDLYAETMSGTLTSATTILTATGEVETVEMKMLPILGTIFGGDDIDAIPMPRRRGAGDASHGSDGDYVGVDGPSFLLSSQSSAAAAFVASAEMDDSAITPTTMSPRENQTPITAALEAAVEKASSSFLAEQETEDTPKVGVSSGGGRIAPLETEEEDGEEMATIDDDAASTSSGEGDGDGETTSILSSTVADGASTIATSPQSPVDTEGGESTTVGSAPTLPTQDTRNNISNKLQIVIQPPAQPNNAEVPAVVSTATPGTQHSSSAISGGGLPSPSGSTPRNRVPGGAAAKLMLLGPQESTDELDSGNADVRLSPSTETNVQEDSLIEIERTMNQAREEFSKGNETNRRYHPQPHTSTPKGDAAEVEGGEEETTANEDEKDSDVGNNTPSFLNKSEIFHKTASEAIAALLTRRDTPLLMNCVGPAPSAGGCGVGVSGAGTGIPASQSDLQQAASSSSAFQTPEGGVVAADHAPSKTKTTTLDAASYIASYGRNSVSDNLLQPKTERKLEALEKRMHDPNQTLTDLLTAIATPEEGLQELSRLELQGFMVRRKNACGALKLLTNDPRKRLRIAWTVGVLPALTSVLRDSAQDGIRDTFPDKRIRAEYEAARDRAITCLLNLSIPKENRIPVFHTPGLMQSCLAVIIDDERVARRGCTAILAYLAKTIENRLLLAQVPGLYDALVAVLRPKPPRIESASNPPKPHSKKKPIKATSSVSSAERGASSNEDDDDDHSSKLWDEGADEGTKNEDDGHRTDEDTDDDSQGTPVIMPSKSPIELTGYDETADVILRASRQNVFAFLGHLGKEKDNAYHFARDPGLLNTLISISEYQESPSHTLAVKAIANMTRHRLNTKLMAFQERRTVPALVLAANSTTSDETRLYAVRAIQNMSQDRACRQELAMADMLVTTLCKRGRYAEAGEERLAAISALKNLCDEPSNLIPLTNTPECIATLMHLAHGKEEGVTETMQYRACDALATLSHWLRKIATSGKSLDSVQRGVQPETKLFVPSLRVVTWNQWQ